MKNTILNMFLASLIILSSILVNAQELEFKIHNRGMLNETVFNSGDIGRP